MKCFPFPRLSIFLFLCFSFPSHLSSFYDFIVRESFVPSSLPQFISDCGLFLSRLLDPPFYLRCSFSFFLFFSVLFCANPLVSSFFSFLRVSSMTVDSSFLLSLCSSLSPQFFFLYFSFFTSVSPLLLVVCELPSFLFLGFLMTGDNSSGSHFFITRLLFLSWFLFF